MDRIKVLVLSTVVPNGQSSGGELLLHRYLTLDPSIQSEVVSWQGFPFRLKVIGKLKQVGLRSISRSWECLFPVLPRKKMVRELIHAFQPDVVLTVAHGWWHIRATAAANEFNLPLVTFFHDWWPDFPDVSAAFRPYVERQFRRTCAESAVAICVSDGMLRELGEPDNAVVVYPVPSLRRPETWRPDFKSLLRVAYFGNLSEYGPLIEGALHALSGSNNVRLEVFGPTPLWKSGAEDYFRDRGLYHGFIASSQLVKPLQGFQAVLVVMNFAAEFQRRMITSFPSKMIDAMQLGLPVVVWGPEYCSAVQWARRGERALCVTDANPSALRHALEELAASRQQQERLSRSAREAAAGEFNSDRIQAQFVHALRRAIGFADTSTAEALNRVTE